MRWSCFRSMCWYFLILRHWNTVFGRKCHWYFQCGWIHIALSALDHCCWLIRLTSFIIETICQFFEEITATSLLLLGIKYPIIYLILNVWILGCMRSIIIRHWLLWWIYWYLLLLRSWLILLIIILNILICLNVNIMNITCWLGRWWRRLFFEMHSIFHN
jgi:hypothetical protein